MKRHQPPLKRSMSRRHDGPFDTKGFTNFFENWLHTVNLGKDGGKQMMWTFH